MDKRADAVFAANHARLRCSAAAGTASESLLGIPDLPIEK